MLTKIKVKLILTIISTGSLVVGFQNCAKYTYNDVANDSSNAGLSTDQLPDNTDTIVNQPPLVVNPPTLPPPPQTPMPAPEPPVVVNPPVPTPEITPPTLPKEDEDCINWAYEKKDSFDKKDRDDSSENSDEDKNEEDHNNYQSQNSRSFSSSCAKSKKAKTSKQTDEKPKCYVNEDEEVSDQEYQRLCNMNKKSIESLNAAGKALEIIGRRGFTVINPISIGSSSLDKIEDIRGHLVVCNMDIKKIFNTRGVVAMINSKVDTFSDHRGISMLAETVIDNCSDIKGVIAVIGDKAVCHSLEKSIGVVKIRRKN